MAGTCATPTQPSRRRPICADPFTMMRVAGHSIGCFQHARVAKLADARDLKSRAPKRAYRFDSGPGHHSNLDLFSPATLASTALQSLGQEIKLYAHPFSP